MRSVADDLRIRTLERVLEMPVSRRIALALSLGDDDLDLFVRTSGLDRAEARHRLRARRVHGRAPSAAAAADGR
jgi:hypothetical protein